MDDTSYWSRYQDVAGQLPSLQSYTQFCLFFPDREASMDKASFLKVLDKTSVKLTSTFPWLGGQVLNEDGGAGTSGVFKILPYKAFGTGFDVLVKEDESLDYATMAARKMPMSTLDGDRISPRCDLTRMYDAAKTSLAVFVLQVTLLKGGVVLTFAAAHNAMDMSGLGKMIELFGRVFQGGEITSEEREWGNRDRRELFELLGPGETMLDHTSLLVKPAGGGRSGDTRKTEAQWAYVRFKREMLLPLKDLASLGNNVKVDDKVTDHGTVRWISTDDALSAFLWQRVTLARLSNISSTASPDENAILCRAVNGRRFLDPPVPSTYMGHMVACTRNSMSIASAATQSLSEIAAGLRSQLNQQDSHSIRSFFSLIHQHKDKNLISFAAGMDLSKDVLLSSGAALGVYHVDFGPALGMPEWVRRPRWDLAEGVIYLMPKTREGHVDAAICLSNRDWTELQQDGLWHEFTEYIG